MKTEGPAHLLRVFVNESDRWEGRPLYETIIRAAKDKGLAGATVLRGIEGYGISGRIHSVRVLHLSEDVPIVVEILDSAERIATFLPALDQLVGEGAVTIEKVHLLRYSRGESADEISIEDEIPLDTSEASPPAAARTGAAVSGDAVADFTDRAHQVIVAARQSAGKSRRAYVDSVDVLLAMLCETRGIAENTLRALGVDCKSVERTLRDTVNRDERAAGYLRTLTEKSQAAAQWLSDEYTGAEHLLLALCQIRPSAATDILMRLGVQPRDISQEVLNTIGHEDDWQRWLADHPEL